MKLTSLFALAALLLNSALAAAAPAQQPLLPPPPAPQVDARGYVLVDYHSGQTLAGRNANERVEPASLTKLMTAYIAFTAIHQGRLSLAQTLPVSEKAWKAEGSRMFIAPNMQVTVDELLHGMIIQSGNDAAITLAEGIAGSEDAFAALMNQEAQRLGMKNTHFMNATGLPHPQHYSTPYDLSLLARAIIHDFPDFFKLYSIKEYRYNNINQPNRNQLLWRDPSVDGMKTGHTEAAGFCLVSTAKRQGMRLISVLVGAASDNLRTSESQKLLNYGFQFYETVKLYRANQPVTKLRIYKGTSSELAAGFARDFYVTVPRGSAQRLKAQIISKQPMLAPISKGQAVATLRLTLDGQPVGDYALAALTEVSVSGLIRRAWDSLMLML